jgi:transcriptional regulator NrdR family protein
MTRPPPENRPTARQLAAQVSGVNPWACPRCGCLGPHKVESTYAVAAGVRRRRICRNCGQSLFHTTEVIAPKGSEIRVVSPDDEERACA